LSIEQEVTVQGKLDIAASKLSAAATALLPAPLPLNSSLTQEDPPRRPQLPQPNRGQLPQPNIGQLPQPNRGQLPQPNRGQQTLPHYATSLSRALLQGMLSSGLVLPWALRHVSHCSINSLKSLTACRAKDSLIPPRSSDTCNHKSTAQAAAALWGRVRITMTSSRKPCYMSDTLQTSDTEGTDLTHCCWPGHQDLSMASTGISKPAHAADCQRPTQQPSRNEVAYHASRLQLLFPDAHHRSAASHPTTSKREGHPPGGYMLRLLDFQMGPIATGRPFQATASSQAGHSCVGAATAPAWGSHWQVMKFSCLNAWKRWVW